MRLLYIITKSHSWGGAQRHVFDLALAMKEKGHEVWVILGGKGRLKEKLESVGIYTFSIDTLNRDISFKNDFRSFKEIFSIIKNKKPDIIHLHSPKACGLGALAGRLLRIRKIISTIHGWSFNEQRPLYQKIAIMFSSWITMILSHKTILLSERDYKQASMFPLVKEKLSLIHLGIKPITFISVDGAKQAIAKIIGISLVDFQKKNVVVTIAELHKNKGLKYLIKAVPSVIEQNPNTIFVIIGEGEDRGSLTKTIEDSNLQNHIFLIGHLENASEYLKAFNVFVLPSIKEGLPYVILESAMASLAVVATTVGGIPEIVDDMKSGILIQPKNHRELAHAISFMVEHPEERKRHGNALKEKVLNNFTFDKMIQENEKVYLKN